MIFGHSHGHELLPTVPGMPDLAHMMPLVCARTGHPCGVYDTGSVGVRGSSPSAPLGCKGPLTWGNLVGGSLAGTARTTLSTGRTHRDPLSRRGQARAGVLSVASASCRHA